MGKFINDRILKLANETNLSILDIDRKINYKFEKKIKPMSKKVRKNFIKKNILLEGYLISNAQIIRNNLNKL